MYSIRLAGLYLMIGVGSLANLNAILIKVHMNFLLFDHTSYDRLYNCSILSEDVWEAKKNSSIFGAIHIFLATIYQVLYLIFLPIMLKEKYWQHSCYRIMFILGVYDVGATISGGTICGIFSVRGDILCTNKLWIFIDGCFLSSLWIGACMTGLVLLINRALDLINKYYADMLFAGRRTYIWLIFPFLLFLYVCLFTKPFIFNSILDASFTNPFLGIPEAHINGRDYVVPIVTLLNLIVAVAYPSMYLIFCLTLWIKTRGIQTSGIVSSLQKQIILQSIIMSAFIFVTACCYQSMQYFVVPEFFYIVTHFIWIASHGASVFTYIFVNKSMRKEAISLVKKVFSIVRGQSSTQVTPLNPVAVHINPRWFKNA